MIYSARGLAFILSVPMAVASSILIGILTEGESAGKLVAMAAVIFVLSFIIIYLALDRLIFAEINRLREKVDQRRILDPANTDSRPTNSLSSLTEDIESIFTEQQIEIDRLRKLEAFRRDFVADVSHELKTPIFAAQGFVHTLLDGAMKEKAVRKKFLKKAAKSLDGLDLLVQDLLILSQIETGQIKMRFSEVDMYALTHEVFEQFKGKSSKKDIALRVEGAVRRVPVYADAQRIGQVMTNLISNAINHSEAGSEVIVSFSIKKKSVVTSVKDSGEGIPAEHINRIFERFYRVDKSRSREKGGTGLGLAIVKHILDGHNSKPQVESKPGRGSIFSFKLARPKKLNEGIEQDNAPAADEARQAVI
jgi:two-component system, OmpR family, phosphate regulon sensor histidine kinase PhoR